MRMLDLDIASDFLLVASTLLELKARALLPKPEVELDDDVEGLAPDAAREVLAQKLIAYKQFKSASDEMHSRFTSEGRMHARQFGPGLEFSDVMPDLLKGATLDGLGEALIP